MGQTWLYLFLFAWAAYVAANAIKIVPQGYEYTVERLGQFTRTLKPGIAVLTPFVEVVRRRVNMAEQMAETPRLHLVTQDHSNVTAAVVMFMQVTDAAVAAYATANLNVAVSQLASTRLRAAVGASSLDEVLTQPDVVNARLMEGVEQATSLWGVKINRLEIKDPQAASPAV